MVGLRGLYDHLVAGAAQILQELECALVGAEVVLVEERIRGGHCNQFVIR